MNKSKYIITTKVQIKSEKINEVLSLFKDTNPELVKDQKDWVRAIFTQDEKSNRVIVHAFWKDKNSYINFSKSAIFQSTMRKFAPFFDGEPQVEINEILFNM